MITLHLRFPEAERSHPILLTPGLLDRCGAALREAGLEGPIALVSDTTVAAYHGARVRRSLEEAGFPVLEILLPPGEKTKTMDTAAGLYRRLAQGGIGRDGLLIGLGGGVVLDLAGFVAATYMLSLIHI